jgi:hypothetical protein
MKRITKNTLIRFYRTETNDKPYVNPKHPEWSYEYDNVISNDDLMKYDFSSNGNEWDTNLWIPSHGNRNGKEIYLRMKALVREIKLESIL